MKILTEKDQLRNKLDELDNIIGYSQDEMNKAFNRKDRKENLGMFSFIIDEQWLLNYTYKRKLAQLQLLEEYRLVILDMFNK